MKTHERVSPAEIMIENYELPIDNGWQDLDDVPADFIELVKLHQMACSNADYWEDAVCPRVSFDNVVDVYDNWQSVQNVLVARDDEGRINGMISYYFQNNGTPFIESLAVDPQCRGKGISENLIDTGLEVIAKSTDKAYAVANAQRRVVNFYERRWGAEVLEYNQDTAVLAVPLPQV